MMPDIKTFADIAEGAKNHKRISLKSLEKTASERLDGTRRLLTVREDYVCRPEREDAARWLFENFARLEETVKNDIRQLRALDRMKRGRGGFLFYGFFCYIASETPRLEEGDIDRVLCICNETSELELQDGLSLVPLLRLAVCMRICDLFCGIFSGDLTDADTGEIRNLFLTVDELCLFDCERGIRHNAIEKILGNDPSGVYKRLSGQTKGSYRKNLIKRSAARRISQKEYARQIVSACSENEGDERHIGKYLADRPCGGKTYLFLVFFMTAVFTLLLFAVSPIFIITVFSVYSCSRLLADKFFVRFFVKDLHLPRIELDEIPDGEGVMTVITSLLTGGGGDSELFENLEKAYHSNGGKNVYFGLLCDLADSDVKNNEKDGETIAFAKRRILDLRRKYGNCFFLFVREREYSKSEQRYIAPERKRGAVNALAAFLCGKSDAFCGESIKPEEKICANIKYVLTLDADTVPAFDSLKTLVGIMMHPQNKPRVDRKCAVVTKGYGILQPAVNVNLESSGKSFFSSVMCGHGGVDLYSSGGRDKEMSMFGRSIFCGKGMFEKNCFCDVLLGENAFGKNRILSHDAPEGARLCCGFVKDVVFTDSFPSEELSYFKRQHRWIRGDIQNIPFLTGRVYNESEEKIPNKIHLFSRFFILNNVHSALLPIFTVISLFVSCILDGTWQVLMVSTILAPYVLPVGYAVFSLAKRAVWHNFRRLFYSQRIYTGIWTAFLQMLFRLCALPKAAIVSLDAVIRSTYRSLVSHRKMLEWTTAAQNDAEKRDGLLGYVKKNLFAALCGTLLFSLSQNGVVRIIALLWLFMPVFAYHSGKNIKKNAPHLDEKCRQELYGYCRDMWKFFEENVGESTNHLPSDNVSLYPERKIARMTSPTNIGLYLLSCLCACRLGFADVKDTACRICLCLESVKKLEKYKGLMYNWYDVFTARPMTPEYVSSVDIGNFIACLICVKEGAREVCADSPRLCEIEELCRQLIEEADLSLLYDKSTRLFFIGATKVGERLVYDRNRYDMLMSEARILSFCAVCTRSVGIEHMKSLSRRFVEGRGYMGLASWSGTAFEYFMPEIFMPSKSRSLIYEALCFAYSNIVKNGVPTREGDVFGISESCFNELDSASNYKYHAFGVPEIAVSVFEKSNVISPYSSFLCLSMNRERVAENLRRLKRLGAYGEYGFYESVDFDRHAGSEEFALVRCFMSHHIGMSIASCTNILCDGQTARWFSNDNRVKSALEITEEKIPYDAYVKKTPRRRYALPVKSSHGYDETPTAQSSAVIKSGNARLFAKKGKLRAKWDELLVTRAGCFDDSLGDFGIYLTIDGERFAFDKKSRLSSDGGQIVFSRSAVTPGGDRFDAALSLTLGNNTCDTVRIRVRLRQLSGEKGKNSTFSVCFYPLLETKKNSAVCSFFEFDDVRYECCPDKAEVCFGRISCGMFLCTGVVTGKGASARLDGERVTLECVLQEKDGIYEAELVLALSSSLKCALSGVVRSREDSFSLLVAAIRNEKEREKSRFGKAQPTGVRGISVQKEKTEYSFPLDSTNGPMRLISSDCFSALCSEKCLGMSFENDINKGRVTSFSGVYSDNCCTERIIADDGFDLCMLSDSFDAADGCAVYRGRYNSTEYTVKVFAADMPCKMISVVGCFGKGLRLCFEPSDVCDSERYIGAGLAFFGRRDEDKKGFVFGFCKDGVGVYGADYSVGDGIGTYLGKGRSCDAEYIFCIGKAHPDNAVEIYNKIREDAGVAVRLAREFAAGLKTDAGFADEGTMEILRRYFVFPSDFLCNRAFITSSPVLSAFDTLLLMYTRYTQKREALLKLFAEPCEAALYGMLLCIALAEYVRITGDKSVPELKVMGEATYCRCLSFIVNTADCAVPEDLFVLTLEKFSVLCDTLGDLRSAVAMRERIKRITSGSGGIFL